MKPLLSRLLLAVGGAIIASLSYPQPGIALLMLVGLPMMVFAFRGASFRAGALLGFIIGFAYYGSVARWLTIYLGVVPWAGLVGMQALIFAGGGVLLVAAWRGTRHQPSLRSGDPVSRGAPRRGVDCPRGNRGAMALGRIRVGARQPEPS